MVTCEVKYDNNTQGIFYGGQTLSGVIQLNNDKPRKIRGLSLRIEGFAKCKWTESEGSGKNRRTISYVGREDYINTFSYLIGNYDVSSLDFAAGLHKFNFACVLPPQLPTSFESKYGYIRYQCKVEIERPWKLDLKFCFAFTVIKILDLNFEGPGLRVKLKNETTKTFFLGFSSKALFISAEIPISGFVAGQTVPVSVAVHNDSSVDIEEVKVSLKKIIHYNSQTPRRRTKERIESAAEVRHAGVPGKSKGNMEMHLSLPPVPPTNIAFCQVIQVNYEIQVLAKVGGLHRSPLLRLPVTIGTVPLVSHQYLTLAPVPTANWQQPGPSNSHANTNATAPQYPFPASAPTSSFNNDLPPPSYAAAMGMAPLADDNDEGLTEEKPFSPMYPIFNFNGTGAAAPMPTSDSPPAYGFEALEYGKK